MRTSQIPIIGQMLTDNSVKEETEETIQKNLMISNFIQNTTKEQFATFSKLSIELNNMGYQAEFYTLCFLVHHYQTIEEAIDLLSKTNNFWNHRYVPYYETKCFICEENEDTHKTLNKLIQYKKQVTNKDIEKQLSKEHADFNFKSTVSESKLCGICLDEIIDNEDYCLKCLHHFCSPCMKEYLNNEINQKHLDNINCPQAKCGKVMTKEEIFELIDNEMKKKYEYFHHKQQIENNPNNILCPYPDCEGYARKDYKNSELIIEEESLLIEKSRDPIDYREKIKCSNGHDLCSKCNQLWHEDQCGEDRELKEDSDAINAVLKRCPSCKIPIFKYEGCNHVTCSCGHQFCWLCMMPYTDDHFSLENTPCYGKQFDIPPDGIAMRIIEMERNHELLYMIIIVFYISYLFTERVYQRGNNQPRPCITWLISFGVILVIFILGLVINFVILISMTYANSKFPNRHWILIVMHQFSNFLLSIIYFAPGLIISAIWFVYCFCLSTYFSIYALINQRGHNDNDLQNTEIIQEEEEVENY